MKWIQCLFLSTISLILSVVTANAQVSGTVFRDFNFNGTQQTSGFPTEPGSFGTEVRAFNAAGTQLGTTKTTDAGGAFSFSAAEILSGTAVRIEFTAPAGQFNAKVGGANGSNVQFVTAPSTTVNYAVANQDWYSSTANPYTATNAFSNGNSEGTGTASTNNNLYVFPWNMGSGTPDDGGATRRLQNKGIGSVLGMAFQRTSRILFVSAFLKRHSSFGPNGIGAIYKTEISTTGVPSAASLLVNVSAIGINVGTDPRSAALPDNGSTPNTDLGVFASVGKRGIGGIDLSDDGKDLYLVNMFDKRLYRINIGAPLKSSFTAADVTGNWAITDPGIAGTAWRPMACKTVNGRVYIGGVTVVEKTTAFNLATDTVGMKAIVYEFNPATQAFTQVLNFPLSRRKGFSNGDPRFPFRNNWWCGWQDNGGGDVNDPLRAGYSGSNAIGAAGAFSGGIYYPQPMFADIEFDVDGSMVIGLRDRMGDQAGYANLMETNPTAGLTWRALCSGEVLRAGRNTGASTFTIESGGSVTSVGVTTVSTGLATSNPAAVGNWGNTTGPVASSGTPYGGTYGPGWTYTVGSTFPNGPNTGTGGGYYYFNNNFNASPGIPAAAALNYGNTTFINAHYHKTNAGLALLAGSNEIANTAMDPATTAFAQGIIKNYNKTSGMAGSVGNLSQRLQLVATTTTPTQDPLNMGKGNGLGNIELLIDAQPIEIGNRVWSDANGNGVQDAGETTITGVTVELVGPGTDNILGTGDDVVLATATTNAAGEYYFSTLTVADSRKPATWDGVGANDILPGFDYQVRINPSQVSLTNFRLTGADLINDNIDSDGKIINGFAAVNFNTTDINHNFDFGFKQLGAIGNRVWLDNGTGGGTPADGLQNGSEPGVAGVTVELFLNGTKIASTVTDAYGNYLFENLATGGANVYTVKVTPPANYSFTAQTNASADLGNDAIGSDVNAAGLSYIITLTTGETERDIDAGLVFNTTPLLASVGDRVWLDNGAGGGTANDGIQNGTETGVAGITVTLYNAAGVPVATTVTDANGNYLFTNLLAGTYSVGFTVPPAFAFSPKDAGGNDNTDSDVNTSGIRFGRTDDFALAAGEQKTNVDAGLNTAPSTTASLGDRVWNDIDRDGVQDADEPGIGGVLVTIVGPSGTLTTTTDANGNFQFTNLTPGSYTVTITNPNSTQYTFTGQDATTGGGNNNNDSDFPGGATATTQITIPLIAGQRGDVDAGLYNNTTGLNSIGNFVWYDGNGNGTQDAGEIGVPGVTATLINTATGQPADNPALAGVQPYVVSTDKNGLYRFADLPNGNYVVIFSNLPNGYTFTVPNGAGDNGTGTNSDVTAASGTTAIYNLTGGEYDQTVDAGIVRGNAAGGPSIGNKVWYDLDNDGIQDAPVAGVTPELGVAGVTVTIRSAGADGIPGNGDDGPVVGTTTTDALGNYLFTSGNVAGGLLPGLPYYLTFSGLPAGYAFSTTQNAGINDEADSDIANTGTGITGVYILGPTEENLSVDAGIFNSNAALGSISNLVFYDIDNDGIQDAGEPGVPGVTVRLFNDGPDGIAGNADDVFAGTTTTDVNGNYLFTGLAADNYTVYFSNYPAGFGGTLKDAGGDDNADSDAPGTGKTDPITLAAGQNRTDIDFGISSSTTAALGNFVWFDSDNDGVQDAGEAGIPGVTVILYRPGFGPDGIAGNADDAQPVSSAITDANGGYLFTNLVPGTYEVEFTNIPSGTSFTTQDQTAGGGNDSNDSDVNPATGRTAGITLTAGQVNLTVDAGIRRQTTANVGNFVWYDTNGNGIKDTNEPPVGGITVTLLQGATVIGTAVTGDDGSYLFTNVAPGTYTIQFGNLPTGTSFTTQNVGGTGADNNSNPNAAGLTQTFTVVAGGADITIDAGLLGTPLPADGLNLAASLTGEEVTLNWKTTSEYNTRNFETERSIDNVNFTKVGNSVTAAGNSTSEKAYSGTDNIRGIQHNGTLYYRVKLYDENGSFRYSNTATVRVKGVGIKVWPNPFAEVLQVSITSESNAIVELRLSDITGRTVLVQHNTVGRGISQLSINNIKNLPAGTYLLQVINAGDNTISTYKLNKE